MTDDMREIPLVEAAHLLGLSWAAAWRLMLTGQLVGNRRNGKWFVNRESVDEFRRRSPHRQLG